MQLNEEIDKFMHSHILSKKIMLIRVETIRRSTQSIPSGAENVRTERIKFVI